MAFSEKVLEGKFIYLKGNQHYSEELFHVERENKLNGNITFFAEILSRVSTGEFLKVNVEYVLTHQFEPNNVCIKRSLGKHQSIEHFFFNLKTKNLSYSFEGDDGLHEFEKITHSKIHISTPAFCTSALMTLSKKIDPVQKTPYTIITSKNIWKYASSFEEHIIYIENKSHESVEIEMNGHSLKATLVYFYEQGHEASSAGTPFYLSKHFNIPYMSEFSDDITVKIERLKITEQNFKDIF